MRKPPNILYGVDETPPLAVTLLSGLQQVGLISVYLVFPLLVGREAQLTDAEVIGLLSVSMIAMAVAAILPAMRIGMVGAGFLCPGVFTAAYFAPSLLAAHVGGMPLVLGMTIFGGFVEMHAGTAADGSDSYAEPLLEGKEWPLEVVIAVTAKAEKEIGSRSGMTRSATSSPYYAAWVAGQPPDLAAARAAIRARDFAALADVAEHNCLKMHAAALAAQPPLVYWNGATVECLRAVRRLRSAGVPVFFTIDAGPQLKAVCAPGARAEVERALGAVPGVLELLTSALGPGAELK